MPLGLRSGSPVIGTLDGGADESYSMSLGNMQTGDGAIIGLVSNATTPTLSGVTVGGETATIVAQQVARSTRLAVAFLPSLVGASGSKSVVATYSSAVLAIAGCCIAVDAAIELDDWGAGTASSQSLDATVAETFGFAVGISGFGEMTADTGWTFMNLANVYEYESAQYRADMGAVGTKVVTMQTNTVQGLIAALFRAAGGGVGFLPFVHQPAPTRLSA